MLFLRQIPENFSFPFFAIQAEIDDDKNREEGADDETDEEGQGSLIHKFSYVNTYGHGHHSRDEPGYGCSYTCNVPDGFHGHGPDVAKQKSNSEKLHGKEGQQDKDGRVRCIVK